MVNRMTTIKTVGNTVKSYSKLYITCLISFALLSILSFVFLMLGILGERKSLLVFAGIWWAGWGSILGLAALPVGITIEIITGGVKGGVHRYIKWILSTFLLTGACISLFSMSIPDAKVTSQTLLPLILMVIILNIIGLWRFFRVFTGLFTLVIFIIHILSLFLPVDFGNVMREKIGDACFRVVTPKRVTITYESLKEGEVEFFRKDGKSKIWYYKNGDGTFEFFSGEGRHPTYNVDLKPVTQEVIPLIEEQLQQEHLRQEQARQEQIRQEQLKLEQLKEERTRQEQIEQERLRQEQMKKEQMDREETARKDLIKPGVYLIEKKLGRLGSGIKILLQKVDILDDRTIRFSFLFQNSTGSGVWIKLKEPDGYVLLIDNMGNRYYPKEPIKQYYYSGPLYTGFWLTLDFEPLKRDVSSLTFQGLVMGIWDDGFGHAKDKFEYQVTPSCRFRDE